MSVATLKCVGPYEILALVGAGGMGEVYKAHDPRLNRTVAIKILPESFAREEKRLRRFEQEARALAALNHPNIVAVYDVGEFEGKPYLVTEFLVGETLRDRLTSGAIPVRKAVTYAEAIAEALSAAHAKGIIHRDLKPENIFLTSSGVVKVLDFGLARSTGVPPGSSDDSPTLAVTPQTEPGVVMGTVGYMSPEQVRGEQVDHRSDIFSFGAVLYEMITGKRAFRGASSVETMNAILKEEPPEILPERSDVPPAVERVLRHCLEKEPERRFESASDLAFDLLAITGSSDSHARQAPKQAKFAGRKAALAALGIAVLVALAFIAGARLHRSSEMRFRKLTFQRGYVHSARFAPDHKTVLYSAAWSGNPSEVYSTIPDSQESRSLGIPDSELLAVSSRGEIAVLLHPVPDENGFLPVGTLARASLSGETTPREVVDSISAADWSPDGSNLAVLRVDRDTNTDVVEYPIGHAIYHTTRPHWLSHLRISRDGKLLAVLHHTGLGDDRGTLLVLDTSGAEWMRSEPWAGVAGLAWVSADKLWVAATSPQIIARQFYEVDLSGRQRLVHEVPGEVTLQDIAQDGAVLFTMNDRRIFLQMVTGGKWLDYSWLDRSIFATFSADGSKLLFHEGGEGAGTLGATYLRRMDGSPPVRLSEGYSLDLSPDQKWALIYLPGPRTQYRLVPTGAGTPRSIATPDIPQAFAFGFAHDREGILWVGLGKDDKQQVFISALDGTNVQAIGVPGVVPLLMSPNGKYVIVRTSSGVRLWNRADISLTPIAPLEQNDFIVGLTDDGVLMYVARLIPDLGRRILRMNVRDGKFEQVAEIPVYDRAGMLFLARMVITPDGKTLAINYVRHLSELYMMQSSAR